MTHPRWCWVSLLALGCAHAVQSTGLAGLKPAAETFHQRVRWRDYRGAGELLVPERRAAFLAARKARNDERDLSISDYELEDARLSGDGLSAQVVSRLSWVRLPSDAEHTATVTSVFVFRDGSWLLKSEDAGPFLPELSETEPEAASDGGLPSDLSGPSERLRPRGS